jgi:hypothetical protein
MANAAQFIRVSLNPLANHGVFSGSTEQNRMLGHPSFPVFAWSV